MELGPRDLPSKDEILKKWERWGNVGEAPHTFSMRDGLIRHACGQQGQLLLLSQVAPSLYAFRCRGCGKEGVLQL